MTLAQALQEQGYAFTPRSQRDYADFWRKPSGDGTVHIAVDDYGRHTVRALGPDGLPLRPRRHVPYLKAGEVLEAARAAEAELAQRPQVLAGDPR